MQKKLKHGRYILSLKKGLVIFDTYAKRGRVILNDGRAKDITLKTHPDMVKRAIKKGERCVSPLSFRKEYC
jgi:hypothetical protein